MSGKSKVAALVVVVAAVAVAFAMFQGRDGGGERQAGWSPKKPVELIIMAGVGGGADQIARLLQGLIEKKGLSPRPFIPINKPGGSGAEALRYLQDKAGDDHVVLVTLNSFYTTPIIQQGIGVDVREFTPIGRMALDNFLLWVHQDRADIADLDGYVAAVRGAGRNWKVGGTGVGQEDSILTAMMENHFNYEVTYIPFPGGGTVAKNLVGKHIDSTVNNPAEQNEFYRAGNTKPLVQFTASRLPAYPDVPTAKELGHDLQYYMQRSINGPPGMSEAAQNWYIGLFRELFESDEWQKFCVDDGLACEEWLAGDDLRDYHLTEIQKHRQLIESVGAGAITGE
ncbi:MAG: tripartite tricarboxylate transporter substrate binding protein [Gammaproteobacteria bacterium]|nr:tripartite tricarboxylate transporter substrate binding protein [Gammaproteobacteria bacterium]MDA7961313.1 tripartite tricarboxylate transporter substrate binding protein [Gammaproteobacteria bacterium]MDA7969888.1 tripartite tricarboxylate transporter substrate binding protein [Gammaproteobacteria bacterium]MDA7971871.1 tripartite tricarboxylate transporter substrate binding protein [Gammaproteobacteria bacterium]MDA7995236.1 tripartite tricarboxylate transporter substrate binding protein 